MYNQLNEEGKSPICLFSMRKACADVNDQLLSTLRQRDDVFALYRRPRQGWALLQSGAKKQTNVSRSWTVTVTWRQV